MSLLINPILSASTMEKIASYEPDLLQADNDTVVLSFTILTTTYSYYIEKERWLVVGLEITGGTVYDASYFYGDSAGIPALEMVAMNNDTSLANGGLRFKNIILNQPLFAQQRAAPRRPRYLALASVHGRIIVSGDILAQPGTMVSIWDPSGRRIFARTHQAGLHQFIWDGTGMNGQKTAAGTYIFSVNTNGSRYARSFVFRH
ncbi:MAG: hypothetical protein GF418_01485 [Chitinivibrionales bacterium]|nr:hypothetical protein [Chitinivibrionales bacterium]MBD3394275.1 hypothetical protein [Chitinivibrionales bacterium]